MVLIIKDFEQWFNKRITKKPVIHQSETIIEDKKEEKPLIAEE
tara:strand:+ start:388 stop:516 length:129 start_codon:yes stop_codon:yes gene_type:complete